MKTLNEAVNSKENAVEAVRQAQYNLIDAYVVLAKALCADGDPYAVHGVMCERFKLMKMERQINRLI